jgi:hypothetical protein
MNLFYILIAEYEFVLYINCKHSGNANFDIIVDIFNLNHFKI